MCVCILSLQSPRGVAQAWPLSVPIVMEVSIGCVLELQSLVQLVYFRYAILYTLFIGVELRAQQRLYFKTHEILRCLHSCFSIHSISHGKFKEGTMVYSKERGKTMTIELLLFFLM